MRSRYRIFDDKAPHFCTSTIVAWLPVFAYPAFVENIFESWRFLQRHLGVSIFAYVVMENHLHWIASGNDLSHQVARFKSFTARKILDGMQQRGFQTLLRELSFFKCHHKSDQQYQFWQEGSHPQQIFDDEMMLQKLEYIHLNPLRRGYVDDPLHWRYSSARNYAHLPGLLDVVTDWM